MMVWPSKHDIVMWATCMHAPSCMQAQFSRRDWPVRSPPGRPLGDGDKMGVPLPVTQERDVFDHLDMDYLEPCKR